MIFFVRPCQSIRIQVGKKVLLKKIFIGVSIGVNLSVVNYERGALYNPCHSLTGPSYNTRIQSQYYYNLLLYYKCHKDLSVTNYESGDTPPLLPFTDRPL